MRRLSAVFALVVLLLSVFLGGCFSFLSTNTTAERVSGTDNAQTKITTVTTPTTTRTTTSTVADVASRKNPANLGDEIVLSGRTWDGTDFRYKILIYNLVRGQEALKMAREWNMFNSLEEGEEIVTVEVDVELIKWDDPEDERFSMSSWSFEFFDAQYTKQKSNNYIVVKDELYVEMYEGGKASGRLAFIVPEGITGYIVYKEQFWWKIK